MTSRPIKLRPLERGDFETLIAWATSPEFLMQWTGRTFSWPLDIPQLEAYLERSQGSEPTCFPFMAIDASSEKVVGHLSLREVSRLDDSALVSCVIVGARHARGSGVGTAMIEQICNFGFGTLHLNRLELYVFEFNHAAIACYERAGFQTEGVIREKRKIGDEYWNACVMSRLRSEWIASYQ